MDKRHKFDGALGQIFTHHEQNNVVKYRRNAEVIDRDKDAMAVDEWCKQQSCRRLSEAGLHATLSNAPDHQRNERENQHRRLSYSNSLQLDFRRPNNGSECAGVILGGEERVAEYWMQGQQGRRRYETGIESGYGSPTHATKVKSEFRDETRCASNRETLEAVERPMSSKGRCRGDRMQAADKENGAVGSTSWKNVYRAPIHSTAQVNDQNDDDLTAELNHEIESFHLTDDNNYKDSKYNFSTTSNDSRKLHHETVFTKMASDWNSTISPLTQRAWQFQSDITSPTVPTSLTFVRETSKSPVISSSPDSVEAIDRSHTFIITRDESSSNGQSNSNTAQNEFSGVEYDQESSNTSKHGSLPTTRGKCATLSGFEFQKARERVLLKYGLRRSSDPPTAHPSRLLDTFSDPTAIIQRGENEMLFEPRTRKSSWPKQQTATATIKLQNVHNLCKPVSRANNIRKLEPIVGRSNNVDKPNQVENVLSTTTTLIRRGDNGCNTGMAPDLSQPDVDSRNEAEPEQELCRKSKAGPLIAHRGKEIMLNFGVEKTNNKKCSAKNNHPQMDDSSTIYQIEEQLANKEGQVKR